MLNSPQPTKTITPTRPAVLLLGGQMIEDGIQSILLQQARWLHRRGYRVVTAFLGDPEGLHGRWQTHLPVPLINLKAVHPHDNPIYRIFRWVGAMLRASRIFAVGEFGIIQTFGAMANLFGLPLARLAGVPVRVGNVPARSMTPHMRKAHTAAMDRCATQMVAATQFLQQRAVQDGIRPERLVLVRRGVPPAEEIDLQLRRRLRSELDVPDDGCLVVSVSEMQSAHAYQDLLQVIPQVLEKFPLTRFALLGEGPARTELVQISRQVGIAAQMRFPGARPDLLRLIGVGDIYLLPSSYNGMPPYLLEAMAAQRPVVAFDCAQVQEFVQPGETALLAAPGDRDALSAALVQLLSDAEVRARIGRAGEEFVQRNHNLERMCTEYAILLDPAYHVEAL